MKFELADTQLCNQPFQLPNLSKIIMGPMGDMLLLGTNKYGLMPFDGPVDIFPREGTFEIWELFNPNPEPGVNVHLVKFLILSKQQFTAKVGDHGRLSDIQLGEMVPIPPYQQGFKDTVPVNEGLVVRILLYFPEAEPTFFIMKIMI
jgi:FtsP/CotA-like multicopper oxidase with cupredoxin domain